MMLQVAAGKNFFVALVAMIFLVGIAHASTIYMYPTNPHIIVNQSITFVTSTTGCYYNLPWNSCKDLSQTTNGVTGWLSVPNETSYYIEAQSNGEYNWTGLQVNGQTIEFTKPGVWDIYTEYYNSSAPYEMNSTESIVTVVLPLKVRVQPNNVTDVYQYRQLLYANVIGGVAPYSYQWYNDSSCTTAIANATEEEYTTNALNYSSESYCVVVNDSVRESVHADANISVTRLLQTPQGTYYGFPGNSMVYGYALLAPSFEIIPTGILVLNVTQTSAFNINVCGNSYNITDLYLTPTSTTITIDGMQYMLLPNESAPFGEGGCTVDLINISWAPIIQTAAIQFYSAPLTSTSTTSISTTSSTSAPTTTLQPTSTVYTTSSSTTIKPVVATQSANVISPKKAANNVLGFVGILTIVFIIVIAVLCILLIGKKRRGGATPMVNL